MKKVFFAVLLAAPMGLMAQSYNNSNDTIIGALIALVIGILIFLVLREVFLWYWKINTIVANQEMTNALLAKNNALLNEQILILKGEYKNPTHQSTGDIIEPS